MRETKVFEFQNDPESLTISYTLGGDVITVEMKSYLEDDGEKTNESPCFTQMTLFAVDNIDDLIASLQKIKELLPQKKVESGK